ncbi:MAG TPA: PVC-type heme-binding CxxCH protein [Planctomycetota bacterium]|nr:PVC-type heme-binding CxxCH protein [Planctomycetota bacterium]
MKLHLLLGLVCLAQASQDPESQGYPKGTRNTEDPKNVPLPPEEALKLLHVPEGFQATLFAAEPSVAQPISMAFDERGRLWVGECYSYESSAGPWNQPVRDRILIFEDQKGDGRFTSRKVFWDGARNLTAVLPGMGGVWACSTPNLLFIPDAGRKDAPDREPVVVLDGWNDGKIGHCVFNGLQWGPDGWLYGNQGIQGESKVGRPGQPEEERTRFNGGIWRYHPTRKIFEVVCEGTTNPWGLDWDDYGQAFFTNCVIGHLWHMIPGAHYERMYGKDFTPNTYGLLKACSDHFHYAGKDWTKSRAGAEHDALGGGHAHAGAMIYLGDNWPASYRNSILMVNIHGHRVNRDLLERRGSGYVGRHGPDFARSDDLWFRGLNLKYGPDGGVYLSDWSDVGECHDTNSVHRTSGRIYKITYGAPHAVKDLDLAKCTDLELAQYQLHPNDWYVRQARRLLQERHQAGVDLSGAHAALTRTLLEHPEVPRKLRALWALYSSGGLPDALLLKLLGHESEHLRAWAVRLLVDSRNPSEAACLAFVPMASQDPSPLVRLFLASALQRMPQASRWGVIEALAQHGEDADDPSIPLMIWYGTEPLVSSDLARASKLAADSKIPLLRQSIARRMSSGK